MPKSFSHPSLKVQKDKPLIYTAMSKHLFYYRIFISAFVLEQGGVPLNPFMVFDYFLANTVDRDLVREGNNNLVKRCDQIWMFGPVSDGALAEIILANKKGKPVHYFTVDYKAGIAETTKDQAELEPDIADKRSLL